MGSMYALHIESVEGPTATFRIDVVHPDAGSTAPTSADFIFQVVLEFYNKCLNGNLFAGEGALPLSKGKYIDTAMESPLYNTLSAWMRHLYGSEHVCPKSLIDSLNENSEYLDPTLKVLGLRLSSWGTEKRGGKEVGTITVDEKENDNFLLDTAPEWVQDIEVLEEHENTNEDDAEYTRLGVEGESYAWSRVRFTAPDPRFITHLVPGTGWETAFYPRG